MGLEIKQVVKNYGSKHVLRDISFQVPDRSFVALLGPSGCGKTTLLNAIAGLSELDGGEIRLDGQTISSANFTLPPEHRKIGMVFQDFALWPHMTAYQNVAFGLQMNRFKKSEIKERVRETLEVFHMESFSDRYPSELSGGQKQRIAMARAIAPHPRLILMDEPLSSLDAQLREEMRWELLRIFHEYKITTIYVTHDQTEAMSMSDTIVLLNDGTIEQIDSPETMYRYPNTAFSARFLDATNELQGIVKHIHSGCLAVETPLGKIVAAERKQVSPGDFVTWICRPHNLTPIENDLSSSSEDYNRFRVKILYSSFHGRVWRYVATPLQMETAKQPERQLQFEFSSTKQYSIGDMVTLSVAVEACRIVPAALPNSDTPQRF